MSAAPPSKLAAKMGEAAGPPGSAATAAAREAAINGGSKPNKGRVHAARAAVPRTR
jgi:hypothetical protein